MELVDPKLGSNFDNEEAIRMIKVALLWTNLSPALRLAMSAVVSMLEGHDNIQGSIMDPRNYGDEFRFDALRDKYDDIQLQSSSDDQTLVDSLGTTQNGLSSTYAHDLYPINLDSP
ncbi:putative LRR receptor-like serine/threonine-protein kinase [Camellia lanceoleosa]|uniref:LRR receptor-like serine/threonine-protein kinase n=1 Tax=Camellia lanceoleosa TaxID=1840588 RepID=A0ACC0GJF5_9ERIC|nr:putative LRR receptor-like serine/threonine-protein kinase [Camellia lanceoleosa]